MIQVQFLDWSFLVDKSLTEKIYSSVDKGGADKCNCSMCKNYIARKHNLLELPLIEFFRDAGVDIDKEYEVYHMGKDANGLHLYGTWFDFAGKILEGPNCKIQTTDEKFTIEHYDLKPSLSVAFLPANLPLDSFFDKVENVVQVDFIFTIPWTIGDEEPE
ncbi:hypothetical protein QTN47_21450 [Danxiaibacter flavus]|uniref:Uncharacterized protein n=1 Tax=Danxiaibacter flavus TaxID=3049108 RepID=A0ABV3ZLW1_9BACT|nr:hypothetical protein QNM32_21455 [Chitinophagaceae bacterium DXS]